MKRDSKAAQGQQAAQALQQEQTPQAAREAQGVQETEVAQEPQAAQVLLQALPCLSAPAHNIRFWREVCDSVREPSVLPLTRNWFQRPCSKHMRHRCSHAHHAVQAHPLVYIRVWLREMWVILSLP